MMGEQSAIRTKRPFEPSYWHMTGDSFPDPVPELTQTQGEGKPENISRIKIKLQDVQNAHFRIKDDIICTPLIATKYVGKPRYQIFLKCENLQHTGSFKARGACNIVASLTPSERSKGCIVAGGRNFLLAMTHYGHYHSVPINVVVPRDCPLADRHRYRENFALVKVHGNDANDASLHALTYCDEIGSKYIHGSDRVDLIAGYGTLGLEILSQLDKVDAIICPVSSGSLVAGLITAVKSLKPSCLIYGVECASSPVMTKAIQEKKPVMVQVTSSSIADSLMSLIASNNAFHVIRAYLDRMITVDEACICRAMITLLEREKMMVEGAGACSVAAVLADKIPELQGKNVVCIISGGNVNSSRVARVIERGLAAEDRLVKLTATLPDVPGALATLLAKICEIGADIRTIVPERTWMKRDIFTASVTMVLETCHENHTRELERKIMKDYPHAHFLTLV